jgi:plasmid maintenance system antidote protein VapI
MDKHEDRPHPGTILRVEYMRAQRMTHTQLEEKSGLTATRLKAILGGRTNLKEVDVVAIMRAFPETDYEFWRGLQEAYSKRREEEKSAVRKKKKDARKNPETTARRGSPIILKRVLFTAEDDQSLKCRFRSECLDVAARLNAQGFACTLCNDREETEIETEIYGAHHLGTIHSGH